MSRRTSILDHIRSRTVLDPETGCHIWQGSTSGSSGRGYGYPRMSLGGGTMAVHRVVWVCENGPIPPRKQIDHLYRNRLCVNEEHLECVTHKENQRRRDGHEPRNNHGTTRLREDHNPPRNGGGGATGRNTSGADRVSELHEAGGGRGDIPGGGEVQTESEAVPLFSDSSLFVFPGHGPLVVGGLGGEET